MRSETLAQKTRGDFRASRITATPYTLIEVGWNTNGDLHAAVVIIRNILGTNTRARCRVTAIEDDSLLNRSVCEYGGMGHSHNVITFFLCDVVDQCADSTVWYSKNLLTLRFVVVLGDNGLDHAIGTSTLPLGRGFQFTSVSSVINKDRISCFDANIGGKVF